MFEHHPHFRRLGFAVLLMAGALLFRWPSMERQIWNLDEGSTITMAQMVLAGQTPYLEAADNRTPLVPYAKALILAVAGDWNSRAIHAAVALMIGLTAVLLWLTARRFGHESVGVIAAILFTVLSAGMLPAVDALTAHTGWFVIFFSALGFWLFSLTLERSSPGLALLSGIAFGLATLAKQPGLLDFGVCLVILLLLSTFGPASRTGIFRLMGWMVAGCLLPIALTALYYYKLGALDDLIFYAWTYNTRYYVPEVPVIERLLAVRVPFQLLLTRLPVVLILGLAAIPGLLKSAFGSLGKKSSGFAVLPWLILGWTASGLVSTMLSGRDFSHYSIQVIPGVSLACGWLLEQIRSASLRWHQRGQTTRRLTYQGVLVLSLLSVVVPTLWWLRQLDTRDGYEADIGRLVQKHTRTDERIFVWGYVPEMHVYARRLPSTRYFYTNWVTGLIPWTNLDWFKDTRYAIVPGSQENLHRDFERRPPGVIVDTVNVRGYLKYPLREQTWLWEKIQREFAEVDPTYTHVRGFRVYRRISDAPYGAIFPKKLPPDPRVTLDTVAQSLPQTIAVKVTYPAGTEHVDLYKDDELYRRIACPPDQAGDVTFFVLGSDLPMGTRRLQALAQGRATLASAPMETIISTEVVSSPPAGPPLEFNGQLRPSVAATNFLGPMHRIPNSDRWEAHAPSQLVYDRPPGLYTLAVEYGINDLVYEQPDKFKTDGIELVVQFEKLTGQRVTLYQRFLNPQINGFDRGPQKIELILPLNDPGRIILWISPGSRSDISSDLAYWKSVRGRGAPGPIYFRDQHINATHVETLYGMQPDILAGINVVIVHAPSQLDFPLQPGMHRLSGLLGMWPGAWTGEKKSAGAIFEFWHVPPEGEPRLLDHYLCDPAHNPAQRSPHPFSVDLPYPSAGLIRLVTRPSHPEDNAFNYTYWGPLLAEEFTVVIPTPEMPVKSTEAQTTYGFADMEESGRKVVFAHVPSQLGFPLPAGLYRLTGEIGLLAGAYTGPDATEGGLFIIEVEDASGHRTPVWKRELNPRDVTDDRGFIPFTVTLPSLPGGRLILRTAARPGHGIGRAWTFWHNLRLDP